MIGAEVGQRLNDAGDRAGNRRQNALHSCFKAGSADTPANDRNAMTTGSISSLQERRAAIVREHIAAEKAHDISRIIATFHRPRYELAPFCSVSDGDQAVRDLLAGLFATFPDFDIEHPQLHHAEEAVVVECVVTGKRHRSFAGVPPSGRRIEVPLVANFDFDGDLLIGEKVDFDLATLVRQLV
jgi:steroid delta-isomerase-like uncharacterized protein